MTTYNFLKPFHKRLNASFYLTYLIQFFTLWSQVLIFFQQLIFKLQIIVEFYVASKPLIRLLWGTPHSPAWPPVLLLFALAAATSGGRVKVRSMQSLWARMNSDLYRAGPMLWDWGWWRIQGPVHFKNAQQNWARIH